MSERKAIRNRSGKPARNPRRKVSFEDKLAEARQRRDALGNETREPANLTSAVQGMRGAEIPNAAEQQPRRGTGTRVRFALTATGLAALALVFLTWSDRPGTTPPAQVASAVTESFPALHPEDGPAPLPIRIARPSASDTAPPRLPLLGSGTPPLLTAPAERPAALTRVSPAPDLSPGPQPTVPGRIESIPRTALLPQPHQTATDAIPTYQPLRSRAVVWSASLGPPPPRPLPSAALPDAGLIGPFIPIAFRVPARTGDDRVEAARTSALSAGFDLGDETRRRLTIRESNVRYFRPEDRDRAARLAKATGARLRDFTGFDPKPPPGTIEFWLSGRSGVPRRTPERRTGVLDGLARDLGTLGRDIGGLIGRVMN